MKKLAKSSYIALVSLIALAFSACTNDFEYSGVAAPENQVYCSNTLATKIEIDKNAGSFDVTLNRVSDKGSISVPLTFEAGEGNIFKVPASVTFAEGQKETKISVTYNPDEVEFGKYTGGTIKIGGTEFDTTYGISAYTFNAGCTAWVDYGTGYYREDCMTTFFGVDNPTYAVKIQKNKVEEGMYRMVNAYGKAYPYNEDGNWDKSQDYYVTINAKDPNHVYVEKSVTGMDWSHGVVTIWSFAGYYMSKGQALNDVIAAHPEYFGKLENGIITMPANSLLISMAAYNDGGLYKSGVNGKWCVALPGHEIADYTVSFTYTGRFTDAEGNNYCQGNVEMTSDVAYVKYALAADSEVEKVLEDMIAGGDYETISKSGTISMPFEESGSYYVLLVPYSADGKAQAYQTFKVKLDNGKGGEETWTPVFIGDYKYTLFFGTKDEPEVDKDLTLYQSDKDSKRYKIEPWGMEQSLTFTLNDDGSIMVDADQYIGYDDPNYGSVYVDDTVDYTGASKYGTSSYADGVFKFALVYYVEAGVLTNGYETFTLTAQAGAKAKAKQKGQDWGFKVNDVKLNHRMLKKAGSFEYVGR